MIKKIKQLLATLSISSLFLVPIAAPVTVLAQDCLDGGGGGIAECLEDGAVKTDPDAEGENASDRVNRIIRLIINIFSLVVGVVSVIFIIIGGLKYITSGGDSGNVSSAKNTILYAIVGLVVVALAQVVVRFVLDKATNA